MPYPFNGLHFYAPNENLGSFVSSVKKNEEKETSVGIMAHYWNGGYTIEMVVILLKWWL